MFTIKIIFVLLKYYFEISIRVVFQKYTIKTF